MPAKNKNSHPRYPRFCAKVGRIRSHIITAPKSYITKCKQPSIFNLIVSFNLGYDRWQTSLEKFCCSPLVALSGEDLTTQRWQRKVYEQGTWSGQKNQCDWLEKNNLNLVFTTPGSCFITNETERNLSNLQTGHPHLDLIYNIKIFVSFHHLGKLILW